eukprot:COSAG05_NODE_19004_length_299_cov_0.915000_2_plen_47_part_01
MRHNEVTSVGMAAYPTKTGLTDIVLSLGGDSVVGNAFKVLGKPYAGR